MSNSNVQVAIIMGSDSDLPIVEASFAVLDDFGVNYTKNVMTTAWQPGRASPVVPHGQIYAKHAMTTAWQRGRASRAPVAREGHGNFCVILP